MSSYLVEEAQVAEAVVSDGEQSYGANWSAWETGALVMEAGLGIAGMPVYGAGKLAAEAVRFIKSDREREKAKKEFEVRKASAAYDELIGKCRKLDEAVRASLPGKDAAVILKEIGEIMVVKRPKNAELINQLTDAGMLKLGRLAAAHKKLLARTPAEGGNTSLAQALNEISTAVKTMAASKAAVTDYAVSSPAEAENKKLRETFEELSVDLIAALRQMRSLSRRFGLSGEDAEWCRSCFNGVSEEIRKFSAANMGNDELKRSVRTLNDRAEQVRVLMPEIEKRISVRAALYEAYKEAAGALGEPVKSIRKFRTAEELQRQLERLDARSARAAQCRELYRKIGHENYLYFAVNHELSALGYKVLSREAVDELTGFRPDNVSEGGRQLPYYEWNDDERMQLYEISRECDLQVIFHDDGTVSMQSISDKNDEQVIARQTVHCANLKLLEQRLYEHWLIRFRCREHGSPEQVMSVGEWRGGSAGISGSTGGKRAKTKQAAQNNKAMYADQR